MTDLFSAELDIDGLPVREYKLAVTILEGKLINRSIENRDGNVTVIRALLQERSLSRRKSLAKKYADKLWTILSTPGRYTNVNEWRAKVTPLARQAFIDVYIDFITQICF